MKCFAKKQDVLHEEESRSSPAPRLTSSRWFGRPKPVRRDDKHASAPAESIPTVRDPANASSSDIGVAETPWLRRISSQHSLVDFRSASFHTAPSLASADFSQTADVTGCLRPSTSSIEASECQTGQHGHGTDGRTSEPVATHLSYTCASSPDARSHRNAASQLAHLSDSGTASLPQQDSCCEGAILGKGLDEQLEVSWPEFKALLQDARWLAADAHIQKLERATGLLRGDLPRALEACGQGSASDAASALESLTDMLQGMTQFESALADQTGYHQSSHKPLQIFYRRQPAATVHHFRFIADFPCALVEVLALAREFDLISSWNWTVPDSLILSERSDMDLSAYAVVRMPWPYNNRYTAVRARGSDCLQEDACAKVIFASCPCEDLPNSARHADRVEVLEGSGVRLEPCWKQQHGQVVECCRVSVQLSADPKMDIPAAIIKFVLTVLSPVVYRLAKHVIHAYVRKPGSALHSRMQQRRHFYGDVEAKVQTLLATKEPPVDTPCEHHWFARG